jgi:hypothetical protein
MESDGARFIVTSRHPRSVSVSFNDTFLPETGIDNLSDVVGRYIHGTRDFSIAAMSIIMNIAHLQAHLIAREVTLKTFVHIGILAVAFKTENVFSFYVNSW